MSSLFSFFSLSLSLIDRRGSERTSSPRERPPPGERMSSDASSHKSGQRERPRRQGKYDDIPSCCTLENVFIFPSHHHRRFALCGSLSLSQNAFGCASRRRKGRKRVSVVVVQGNVLRRLSSLSTIEKRCVNAHTRDKTVIEHERLYPKR